jgi:hypothetical protein
MFLVDNSASHPAATSALREVSNYLHYHNILMYPLIYLKWGIVQIIYGIANWASQFMTDMLNTSSLVNQINGKGEIGQMVSAARSTAAVLMVLALIWVGVKIIINHEAPQLKNVVIQAILAVFLLTNLGTLTEWVNDQSVSIAKGFLGQSSNVNKDNKSYKTSDLPFKILSATTNDNEYLINTNFKDTPVKFKSNIKDTDSLTPAKVVYGRNNLKKSDVDAGNINFYKIIDWNDVDDNMPLSNKDADWKKGDYDKTGTHFLYGWLKYHKDQVPTAKSDKTKWISPDIPRWGGTNNQSSLSWGGYPRYEVNWIPCIVSLLVLTVAYIFAGYVIIKSFIELVLMNVLGLFLIGSDLSTGQKTKQVVQEVFSASLLISLQAFELALYEALVSWAVNGLAGNTWGFMIFMIAASIMVITGSQKVTKFFGVDTGAQHGLQAAGSVMYAGKQIGKGIGAAAGMAMLPSRATSAIKNTRDKIGHKYNTKGSMKRDAKTQAKEAARQNAIDKMAGFDRNGNRTVDDFDKANPNGKNLIHQTAAAEKAATQAYRKAAKGTRQADIRQRRRDAIALGARAVAGDHDGLRRATGQAGKPLANDIKQFKEGKLMSKDAFNDELNRQAKPANTVGAVNQSGPTSLDKYHDWQKRADAYDKANDLAGTKAAVGINPETNDPYSYDEWRNNVGDVRTNDVPDTNLDGSKFEAPTDSNVQTDPRSVEEFDQAQDFKNDENGDETAPKEDQPNGPDDDPDDPNDPPTPPSGNENNGDDIPPKDNKPTNNEPSPNNNPSNLAKSSKFVEDADPVENSPANKQQRTNIPNTEAPTQSTKNSSESRFVDDVKRSSQSQTQKPGQVAPTPIVKNAWSSSNATSATNPAKGMPTQNTSTTEDPVTTQPRTEVAETNSDLGEVTDPVETESNGTQFVDDVPTNETSANTYSPNDGWNTNISNAYEEPQATPTEQPEIRKTITNGSNGPNNSSASSEVKHDIPNENPTTVDDLDYQKNFTNNGVNDDPVNFNHATSQSSVQQPSRTIDNAWQPKQQVQHEPKQSTKPTVKHEKTVNIIERRNTKPRPTSNEASMRTTK